MNLGGYTGKCMKVDLTSERIEIIEIDRDILTQYIGGRGLIAWYFSQLEPGIEPFSEQNPLIIATGPVTGTLMPTSGRFALGSMSPLTGLASIGYSGGHWAPELKYAGFDALIITGRAQRPVYLLITDEGTQICDASFIWGQDVRTSEAEIRKQHNCSDLRVLGIGPAGENLVHFASIMVDSHHTIGRGGKGAVMGWKNLKAVAVRGNGGIRVATEMPELRRRALELFTQIQSNKGYSEWRKLGTAGIIPVINEYGILPTRNFETGYFEGIEKISDTEITKLITNNTACFNCNIACAGIVRKGSQSGSEIITERPEYETFWSLGPMLDNSDMQGLLQMAHYCDIMGMDTMEAGHLLAMTADMYAKGVISSDELDGLTPTWGNTTAFRALLQKIVKRTGFGDVLADGLRNAAETIGPEAVRKAMHVKGFILSGYDPRGSTGMALNYATAARGADHNRAYAIAAEMLGTLEHKDRFDEESTPQLISSLHERVALVDSAVMCTFTRDLGLFDSYPSIISLVTGLDINDQEACVIGKRIVTLERLLNLREGLSKQDDALPDYFKKVPMPSGPSKGHTANIAQMLTSYYELMKWDRNGVPTDQCLKELNLS